MKITSITGAARGLRVAWDLTAPVTVLVGPTGAGKTTAVSLALWALEGRLRTAGKPVSTPGEIFAALSADGAPVACTVSLEHEGKRATVARRLSRDGAGKVTQDVECSAAPAGAGARAVQAAIDQVVGRVSVTDIGAWLALGPSEARRVLLDACASSAEPWTGERVEGALRQAIGDALHTWDEETSPPSPGTVLRLAGMVEPAPGEDWHQALTRRAGVTHRAALDAVADLRRLREHATALDQAVGPGAGDPTQLRRQRDEAQARAEQVQRQIGQAEGVERERGRLQAELAGLPEAPTPDRPAGHEPDLRLPLMRKAVDEAQSALAVANATGRTRDAEWKQAQAAVGALAEGRASHCPTCLQEVGPAAATALREALAQLQNRAEAAVAEADEAHDDLSMLQADLRRALDQDARRRQEAEAAQVAWAREQRRADHRRDLVARLASMPAAIDLDALRWELEQHRSRAGKLGADLELAVAADERDRQAEQATKQFADLEAQAVALAVADRAWQRVVRSFGAEAIGPFTRVVGDLLPAGWEVGADLDAMDLWVDRPGKPRALVTRLSRGETVLWHAAAGAALARMSGARLRLVVADHAEALSDDGGLLVAAALALDAAACAGVIDQALLCTGRLTEDEDDALPARVLASAIITADEPPPDEALAALEQIDRRQLADVALRLLPMWVWEDDADVKRVAEVLREQRVPVEHVTACVEQVIGARRRRQRRAS